MSSLSSAWKMNKEALLNELRGMDVLVHQSWTVPELRTLLIDKRKEIHGEPTKAVTGLSKMSLEQLIEECTKAKIDLPQKPTRGQLMLLLRDSKNSPDETVVPFGRYRGWMYQEVPQGYMEWAVREVIANTNPSPDLVKFANWANGKLTSMRERKGYPLKNLEADPEAKAKVKPPTLSDVESSDSSWSRVSTTTSRKPPRKALREHEMEEDVEDCEDAQAEIAKLQKRLEALKRKEKQENMRSNQ